MITSSPQATPKKIVSPKQISVIPARQVSPVTGVPFESTKRVCAYCRVSTETLEQQTGDHGLGEKALGDTICQEEYVRIKSELESLKSQKEDLESHLTILQAMKRRTDDLVITLQDRKDLLTLFDESIFMTMVEKVTVKPSGGLEFQLKNGVGVE